MWRVVVAIIVLAYSTLAALSSKRQNVARARSLTADPPFF
jgi:hypothetical protein